MVTPLQGSGGTALPNPIEPSSDKSMKTTKKIGVFICECGPNIKEAVDVAELSRFAEGLENVVTVKTFGLFCSKVGKDLLIGDIQAHGLTRVVIAACSPKEHEKTFREAAAQAGLNPFLIQIANIREQCAWVVDDKKRATEKAKALLAAAVNRVAHHAPLERRQIECLPDVVVVGAGAAGISAALTLAQKQRKVFLVEKSPCVGGHAVRFEDLYPSLECGSCVLDPWLDGVLHHDRIEVLTLSEIQEVLGFYGQFQIKVHQKARFVDPEACIGCGACFDACPVLVKNEYNEGLDERKAVYIPYAGALPNVAVIDKARCLRWQGQECSACQDACPFGAIRYDEQDEFHTLSVGAVVLATGFELFNPASAPQYGYGQIADVYTSLEFERLLSSSGPTKGKVLLKNGTPPKTIAFVHCVGSRTRQFYEHCSAVCCMYLCKFMHQVKKQLSQVEVSAVFSDLCLPGKDGQPFFNRVTQQAKAFLIRVDASDTLGVVREGDHIQVRYVDPDGLHGALSVDMVVLAPAMTGVKGADDVAETFGICQDKAGFFVEDQTFLAPVSTLNEGVYVAGCAQSPQDIPSSVAQGQAAAGKILSVLVPGEKLTLEGTTAWVNPDLCAGCKTCMGVCPYRAIHYDAAAKCCTVNEILCRGCGVCAAACPSGAMEAKHFSDEAISAEIAGLAGT
jgi:heterodisulfide reductase subunit A2